MLTKQARCDIIVYGYAGAFAGHGLAKFACGYCFWKRGALLERFCDRCGSLVSGDVKNCTFCGAEMDKKLVVSSSLDVDTGSIFDSDSFDDGDDSLANTVQESAVKTPQQSRAQAYSSPYKPQANNQGGEYIPLYTAQAAKQENEFTTAQWLGTLLLAICFGIVSDVILIIWARDDSNMMRRNFARAMLIIAPIVHFGFSMVLLVAAAFILA